MSMKLIVAGPRHFDDYRFVEAKLDYLLQNVTEEIEFVSGACDVPGKETFERPDGTKVYGVDGLGERYASERGYPVKYFPADWKKYGKRAGPVRNTEMAEYGTHAFIVKDGETKGTNDMIVKATDHELILRIANYKK